MSLLLEAYRQLAKNPDNREQLREIARLSRASVRAMDPLLTAMPIIFATLKAVETYLIGDRVRLTSDADAIERALREVAS